MANPSTKKQISNIQKKAKQIQQTFNKVKGSMSQADINKASAGIKKATTGISDINKSRKTTPVITPDNTKPTDVANIPKYTPPSSDFSSILSLGNTELVDGNIGLTQQDNKFVYDPNKSAGVNAAEEANLASKNNLSAIAEYLKPKENEFSDAYAKIEKDAGIKRYQKDVDTYSQQLNTIVANRDANILKLEGQGRGISDVIIGGQQAQVQKEAAIQALPVQALLASAQGNLEMAQSRVNTLFQIKSQDITARNTYKTNLANSVLQYADKAQQNILNAKLNDIKIAEERTQQAINDAKSIAMQAIEYGQTGLATRVMGLDTNSKTYEQDVRNAMVQLRKPAPIVRRDTQVVDGKLIDMQTGEVISNFGITVDGKQPSTDLVAYAQQYASTGKIPTGIPKGISFGSISQLAKELPKPTGTMVNINTGVKDDSVGTAEKEDITRLYNITKMANKLAELDKNRIGGVVSGTLGKVFGSEAQSAYMTQRKAIIDEIARMQTGAALTTGEQKFYNEYLPGRFSESFFLGQDSGKKIENFANVMNEKLQNSLANNQLAIYGYSKINTGSGDIIVGDIITNEQGQKGVVNADGTITLIGQ